MTHKLLDSSNKVAALFVFGLERHLHARFTAFMLEQAAQWAEKNGIDLQICNSEIPK